MLLLIPGAISLVMFAVGFHPMTLTIAILCFGAAFANAVLKRRWP